MFRGVLAVVAVTVIWGLASATSATAASSCWQQLVHDWADGRIAATYPVSCYRQALARMPEDLLVYSSAPDDIEAALQRHVHRRASRSLAASTASRGGERPVGRSDVMTALALTAALIIVLGTALAWLRVGRCTGHSRSSR